MPPTVAATNRLQSTTRRPAIYRPRRPAATIRHHIGVDPTPPRLLPARSAPQLAMDFAQANGPVTWDEVNQTTECPDDA